MAGKSQDNKIFVDEININTVDYKGLAEYKDILPDVNFPQSISFNISGVNNSVSNAIRRTIASELPVKYLELNSLITSDEFIVSEMISKRIKMIPIKQDRSINNLELHAVNTTDHIRDVKTSEFTMNGQAVKDIFNSTFTICTLNPGRELELSNIKIKEDYGYLEDNGMLALGFNTSSITLDEVPMNLYTKTGISSSVSKSKKWKVSFNTNGTMEAKKIVIFACDELIKRVNKVKSLIDNIEQTGNRYKLKIPDESYTIGNLFMRHILELHPNLQFVVFRVPFDRECILDIVYNDNIGDLISDACDYIVDIFEKIKIFFL